MQLIVIVKRLNKRSRVPHHLPEPSFIVGEVKEGFTFEGVEAEISEVPNSALGKWYKDRDGYFYWGAGVREVELPEQAPASLETIGLEVAVKKDWGFIDFKIDELWTSTKGKEIQVSVLDTGLNSNLADFKNKPNILYYNALTDSTAREDCLDSDLKGHGTDCAAMLGSQGVTLFGVSPDVNLSVIRITNANGERTLPAVLKGLSKAIELKSDIISLSFTVSKNNNNAADIEKMHTLIKEAYAMNITIVAAVGDSGELPFPVNDFPSAFPECLSIGGINRSRKRGKTSAKSIFLDLMGPGEDLISLATPGKLISGTSFSTPFVAGIIALLKSAAKADGSILTNIALFDILKRSADKNIANYNLQEHGWGIVDPVAALKLLSIL